ncbi:MAG: LemA family protein [Candidatus Omnitrophica bacterium]|nr:LemA family protein [Candidatus Omnitrophota bacterium]
MVIIGIFILALGTFVAILFNRLVRNRELMREAWSGIDVQLKRRHDLIPNIIDTVKGYALHESKVLEKLTELRSKATKIPDGKEKSDLENNIAGALKTMFILIEAYPDLKADKSYLELQNNLIEIEDQLQLARRYYNGTVRNYNILIQSFPSNIIARTFNYKEAVFFEIKYATERKVPDVHFEN